MAAARSTGILGAFLLLLACREPAAGGGVEGEAEAPGLTGWSEVLASYHRDGGLDYAGLKRDRAPLDAYLEELADARPATGSVAEQTAFWINAYNAVVAEFVLRLYPDIVSVKDVDGFFDRQTYRVAGEELTLDEIESRARDLGDPRVHFAVVCASTSCPDLRFEPFEAGRLDAQLEEQTAAFLAQTDKGMRYDAEENQLWLSSIFKWYAGDFTGGSTVVAFLVRGKLVDWVVPHLPDALGETLAESDPSVRYLDYDWSLNDRPGAATVQ